MIKFFGAVLIVISFGIWGVSKSEKLKKRCDSLLSVISSLNLLENEIAFSQKDIASALLSVGNMENLSLFVTVSENLKNSSVPEAFSLALKNPGMCLSKSDGKLLIEFSQSLGSLGKESQIGSIHHTKELLASARVSALEEYGKYGRLYRSMGILLGFLVAVILI